MNRDEFIKRYFNFLVETGLSSNQVRVGSGGVLLLLNLRSSTQDLDLELTSEVYRDLVSRWDLKITKFYKQSGEHELAVWDNFIDLHIEPDLEDGVFIDGVWSATVEKTLELKRCLNREKDQRDIVELEKLLN
jgi:hypothetical protein